MDFPSKTFPYQLSSNQQKKRDIFEGFGCHGNIDIADISSTKFMSQKNPCVFLNNEPSFCALRPSLPLSLEPAKVTFPFKDRIMEELRRKEAAAGNFILSTQSYRNSAKQKKGKTKFQTDLEKVVKQLRKIEREGETKKNLTELTMKVPTWLDKCVEKYEEVKDLSGKPKINSAFTGGCMCHLTVESTQERNLLITPSAPHFQDLNITETSEMADRTLGIINTTSYTCGYEIREVKAERVMYEDLVAVRGKSICELLRLNTSNTSQNAKCVAMESVCKATFDTDVPTSICLSPFIPCECVVATNTGNVQMWTVDGRKEIVIAEKSHRFTCHDTWRQAMYGAHPRHVIVADNTAVEMFDLRKNVMSCGIDLFALPSKFLQNNERVRVIEQTPVSSHCFIVATDYSILMVDERFPGTPILQWPHTLVTPPQYLSSVATVGGSSHALLSFASQSPTEVCCQMFDYRDGNPPQTQGSIWKLSQIDDFTKWSEICTGSFPILAQERFKTSLAGITTLNNKDGFCSIQVDSQGDMFYQQYKLTNQKKDKTFAAGPESHELKLDEVTLNIGRTWMQKLHQYTLKERKKISETKQNKNINKDLKQLNALFSDIPPHLSCTLCVVDDNKGGSEADNPENRQGEISKINQENQLCNSCCQNISTGRQLLQSETQNLACSWTEVDPLKHTNDLEPVENLPQSDFLSQILLRQWNDNNDIGDLLIKRDEEIKAKKKERKNTKLSRENDEESPVKFNTVESDQSAMECQDQSESESDAQQSAFTVVSVDGQMHCFVKDQSHGLVGQTEDTRKHAQLNLTDLQLSHKHSNSQSNFIKKSGNQISESGISKSGNQISDLQNQMGESGNQISQSQKRIMESGNQVSKQRSQTFQFPEIRDSPKKSKDLHQVSPVIKTRVECDSDSLFDTDVDSLDCGHNDQISKGWPTPITTPKAISKSENIRSPLKRKRSISGASKSSVSLDIGFSNTFPIVKPTNSPSNLVRKSGNQSSKSQNQISQSRNKISQLDNQTFQFPEIKDSPKRSKGQNMFSPVIKTRVECDSNSLFDTDIDTQSLDCGHGDQISKDWPTLIKTPKVISKSENIGSPFKRKRLESGESKSSVSSDIGFSNTFPIVKPINQNRTKRQDTEQKSSKFSMSIEFDSDDSFENDFSLLNDFDFSEFSSNNYKNY